MSNGNSARAICDRCRMAYPYNALRADGQSKGLRVCTECYDYMTPYAYAPLPPDPLILRYPRPQVHLLAWQYRNESVYGGGPLSISPPPNPNELPPTTPLYDPNEINGYSPMNQLTYQKPPSSEDGEAMGPVIDLKDIFILPAES